MAIILGIETIFKLYMIICEVEDNSENYTQNGWLVVQVMWMLKTVKPNGKQLAGNITRWCRITRIKEFLEELMVKIWVVQKLRVPLPICILNIATKFNEHHAFHQQRRQEIILSPINSTQICSDFYFHRITHTCTNEVKLGIANKKGGKGWEWLEPIEMTLDGD